MSKSTKVTIVGPRTVRALFHDGVLDASKVTITKTVKGETVETVAPDGDLFAGPQGRGRGRVSKAHVEAALAHLGAGHVYKEKVESVKMVEVPLFDKRDRKTGRKASIPLAQFRALSGQPMGRPSQASLTAAGKAVSAQRRK